MDNYLESSNIIEEKILIGEIPAILFRPKDIKGLYPTIIFYHGWSSKKEFQRMRGFTLATLGYQVIIPDAIYHGERNPIEYNANNSRYFWDVIFNNLDESNYIIEELIERYDADPNRIGVIGNSMGGITAAGVFTHNPKIKALVVLNGSCGWENSNQIFKKALGITMTEDMKNTEKRINEMDPINNLELLKDRPILMLHGSSDSIVHIESQRLFYRDILPLYQDRRNIKLIEYPRLDHFVTTNMIEESAKWFYKHI